MNVFFRNGHMAPELVRDLDEYFRHLAHSDVYEMVPERAADPPEFITTYERVDPEHLPLRTFAVRVRGPHYLFVVRADMMSAEALDEMNGEFLPPQQGALRTVERRPPALQVATVSEMTDVVMSDVLDRYGVNEPLAA
ncbi:hypothetical protein U5640_15880 [Streptomyces sp. SS7]|uniref:hypothetical protein n=1 Tax=Streptomyces sp. SS7 TaxID=3108485 RepID=UPI0030EEC608